MDNARYSTVRRSLHVFGSLATGGAETWFLRLLASRRPTSAWTADVCLLDPRPGPYVDRARELGCRIVHCPLRPRSTFAPRLTQILRQEGYAAVHSHVLLFGGVIAAAGAAARTPVRTVHAHNSRDGRSNGWSRRLYRQTMRSMVRRFSNLRLACSGGAAELLDAEATLFPYGLDLSAPSAPATDLRVELGLSPGDTVLGHVARFHPQKNQKFLINSFSKALGADPSLRLVIVGEGELRPEIEERIRAQGLAGQVRLTGRRSDVPELLHHLFDGFVMPSLYEGLPVALLEAQAAGLPCLVSNVISSETFAVPRLIRAEPLAADWGAVLVDWAKDLHALRIEPQAAAPALRTQGFCIDDAWDRLTSLYDETLGDRARAARAA